MATFSAPGRESSTVKCRPRSGATPRTGMSSGVTTAEMTRLGRSGVPKRTVAFRELGPLRQGDPESVEVESRKGARNEQQLLGMRIRQRLQQDAVDDAENGRVRPNAEGEGEDAEGCVDRTLGNRSKAVHDIVRQTHDG